MAIADHILASMQHELHILKHLHCKLPAGDEALEYRPTPEQRSTRELLTYLADCCWPVVRGLIANDWAAAREVRDEIKPFEPGEFPARIDAQSAKLAELLKPVTDEQMLTQESSAPWGTKMTLHQAMIDVGVKFLATYRMQLFLYLKAMGVSEISTINNWGGIDAPPKKD